MSGWPSIFMMPLVKVARIVSFEGAEEAMAEGWLAGQRLGAGQNLGSTSVLEGHGLRIRNGLGVGPVYRGE